MLCGVQVCALVLGISWWAPWGPAERIGLVVVAAVGFIVPLRAGATQLLVADLGPLVEAERQRGTRLVIEETSRELLPILDRAPPAGYRAGSGRSRRCAGWLSRP